VLLFVGHPPWVCSACALGIGEKKAAGEKGKKEGERKAAHILLTVWLFCAQRGGGEAPRGGGGRKKTPSSISSFPLLSYPHCRVEREKGKKAWEFLRSLEARVRRRGGGGRKGREEKGGPDPVEPPFPLPDTSPNEKRGGGEKVRKGEKGRKKEKLSQEKTEKKKGERENRTSLSITPHRLLSKGRKKKKENLRGGRGGEKGAIVLRRISFLFTSISSQLKKEKMFSGEKKRKE